MKAVVWDAPGKIHVADVDEPEILGDDDAIVEVELAGVCGSDLHLYHGTIPGFLEGMTLGHEFVGRVLDTGPSVRGVKRGDHVVASFQIPCGACPACARRAFHACRDLYVHGYGVAFGSLPGAQAERVRVPRADLGLWKIPKGVSPAEALFAGDVLSAAYTGVRPHLAAHDIVAVVGAGPVGLMAMEVARALGASTVYAIDLDKRRLSAAASRGHRILDPTATDPVAGLFEATDGWGADLVVEAVGGRGSAFETAFRLAAPSGRVVSLGVPTEQAFPFPWLEGFNKGLTFHATLANVPRWIDEVLKLQAEKRLSGEWLVSHRMPLAEAEEAYRLFDSKEATKVLLVP